MDRAKLEKSLREKRMALEQSKAIFHQLQGQITLLEELLRGEEKKESGQ